MDETRVWREVLTPEEMLIEMNSRTPVKLDNLELSYDFEKYSAHEQPEGHGSGAALSCAVDWLCV